MRLQGVVQGARQNPFASCGLLGFAAGSTVSLALSPAAGLSLTTQMAAIGAGSIAFVAVVGVTEAATGAQTLTFYHDALAVLAATAAVVATLRAPVLGHLEVTAVGLLVLLAFGRVGCLLVGCCHGRPAARGIIYGRRHAGLGLPVHLIGRSLVPVPLFECAVALALAALGAGVVASRAPPGSALGLMGCGYALARCALEELRGDWERRQIGWVSEAQWTSLGVVAVVAVAGLPPAGLAPALLAAEAVAIGVRRRARRPEVLDARHVRELVTAARSPASLSATSRGIRVSAGAAAGRAHVSFSSRAPLSAAERDDVAAALWGLCLPPAPAEVVPGAAGVVHVVTGLPPAAIAGEEDEGVAGLPADAHELTAPASWLPGFRWRRG